MMEAEIAASRARLAADDAEIDARIDAIRRPQPSTRTSEELLEEARRHNLWETPAPVANGGQG